MTKKDFYFLIKHVLLPLFIGGMIYILWRPTTLKLFSWSELAGLSKLIYKLRRNFNSLKISIPEVVIFSLPNGLWVYSYTAFMGFLWLDVIPCKLKWLWIFAAIILSIITEIAQLFNYLQGTFDIFDFILALVCFFASVFVLERDSYEYS